MTVKCKLCPGIKQPSTARNSASNLSKQLQRQPANTKLEARDLQSLSDSPSKQLDLQEQQQVTTTKRRVVAYMVEDIVTSYF